MKELRPSVICYPLLAERTKAETTKIGVSACPQTPLPIEKKEESCLRFTLLVCFLQQELLYAPKEMRDPSACRLSFLYVVLNAELRREWRNAFDFPKSKEEMDPSCKPRADKEEDWSSFAVERSRVMECTMESRAPSCMNSKTESERQSNRKSMNTCELPWPNEPSVEEERATKPCDSCTLSCLRKRANGAFRMRC